MDSNVLDPERGAYTNRRAYLRWLAVGSGATVVAGCLGDDDDTVEPGDDDDDDDDTVEPGDDDDDAPPEPVDATLRLATTADFDAEDQFNVVRVHNFQGHNFGLPFLINEPIRLYNSATDEMVNYALDEFEAGDGYVNMTLRDDLVWHNGDEVTAEDLYTQVRLGMIFPEVSELSGSVAHVEGVEVTGDLSVEVETTAGVSPDLTSQEVMGGITLATPHALFEEYLEDWDDAVGDEDAEEAVKEDMLFEWEFDDAYGCGPYELAEQHEDLYVLEPFEDHYAADNIYWTEVEWEGFPGDQIVPGMQTDQFDAVGQNLSEDEQATLDDHWMGIGADTFLGWAIMPLADDEIFGIREVRLALAHIIDTQLVADAMGEGEASVHHSFAGFHNAIVDEWIDETDFTVYDSDDRAEELLLEAGFSYDDGTWYTPDDEEWVIEVSTWDDMPIPAESVAGQLDTFGLNAEANIMEGGTYWESFPDQGIPLGVDTWGSVSFPNPYFALDRDFRGFPAQSTGFAENLVVEVPPVGDADGELQEVDIDELLGDAASAEGDEFVEKIVELAWVRNQIMPSIPVTQMQSWTWYSGLNWEWASEDNDEIYGLLGTDAPWIGIQEREGTLHPRE